MKRVQRQMLQHLREHELAQVHRYLPRAARPQDGSATRRPRGSNRQLDERSLLQCFSMTCCNPSAQRWDTTAPKYRITYAEIVDGPMLDRLETRTFLPPVNTKCRTDPPATDTVAC